MTLEQRMAIRQQLGVAPLLNHHLSTARIEAVALLGTTQISPARTRLLPLKARRSEIRKHARIAEQDV